MRLAAVALLSGRMILAQNVPTKGEKAILSPQLATANAARGSHPWFYLTRLSANGTEERVQSPYVFASRSKAYLNIMPMQDGQLVIFAGDTPDLGKQKLFFPFSSANGSGQNSFVRKGENIKVPMNFDDKPSETKLTVLLIEDSGRNQTLRDLIRDRSPKSAQAVKEYLEGGRGLVDQPEDEFPKFQPPFVWSKLSLRNR